MCDLKKEIKIKRKHIFKGKVFNIYEDDILNHHNNPSIREMVDHSGGVGIIAYQNDDIILIKQYRYAIDQWIYEIPAGKLELNENPNEAAIRELKEETGYHANHLESLGMMYPTPGYSNEKIYLFLATDLEEGEPSFDRDEWIVTEHVQLSEAIKMIENHQILDAKTIIAIYHLHHRKEETT